ncbi:hypothetical protein [Argonema galeatum]|uniref:hypothetical protein n=1 Tax=Argonema galeatum TaxID=2942762 RepID=UPI0020113C6B|nr:hypothetical protein [Argonema galeatum]MCL1464886.1 hypothetical protein [Argonema galeatum A003/A1]
MPTAGYANAFLAQTKIVDRQVSSGRLEYIQGAHLTKIKFTPGSLENLCPF